MLDIHPANPKNLGPASVLAWIKGGEPGHVIISQSQVCDWLCISLSDGSLMSKLSRVSWNVSPLSSVAVITDGQWHHIGLVWGGLWVSRNDIEEIDRIEIEKENR